MGDENVTRRIPLLLAIAALAVLVVPSSTSAFPPAPQPSCSPGPADCAAWHTGDVTVSWAAPPPGVTPSGCGPVTISQDTGGTGVSCTWSDGSGSVTSTAIVRRDASAPAVGASPERGPDSDGWYNRPLGVSFSGDDATSGIASCTTTQAAYSGPDSGEASVRASCTDNAGNTGGASYDFKYDSTPPTVEAKPDRQPDARGWYTRELTVAFNGADVTSGLRSCAPPVTYKGPDAPKTAVSGTCTDKAANTSPPAAYELRYDTRPPVLARVRAEITVRGIVLRWKASKDTFAVGVVRRPGLEGKKPSTLYSGRAALFTDRRLRKGVKYRYTVTAYDEAGNGAVKGLAVKADVTTKPTTVSRPSRPAATKPALTKPALGARVKTPPLLAWRAVPKASYYNVQLFLGGQKIMTVWPSNTSFQLPRSWKFQGRTYRLRPGTYRWYVWPGLGARSANRYGKLIGTRTFVVIRA
jgi:hypothetical protein